MSACQTEACSSDDWWQSSPRASPTLFPRGTCTPQGGHLRKEETSPQTAEAHQSPPCTSGMRRSPLESPIENGVPPSFRKVFNDRYFSGESIPKIDINSALDILWNEGEIDGRQLFRGYDKLTIRGLLPQQHHQSIQGGPQEGDRTNVLEADRNAANTGWTAEAASPFNDQESTFTIASPTDPVYTSPKYGAPQRPLHLREARETPVATVSGGMISQPTNPENDTMEGAQTPCESDDAPWSGMKKWLRDRASRAPPTDETPDNQDTHEARTLKKMQELLCQALRFQ
ncbi:uncharacterized protein EMH_0096020 [Eimeria mitis]|uniref:Uncharacterized protein n=1 Tax=Eimeria mitis TaxID=44415 RepID=U6KFQ6_9EIME|nr:uncharacterized protein EMH_0096020 [Eimeria mitis]CDJ36784.1 hypothetical protein, conserved [Eimeria mitis]